jgi:putative PIN family toxin of toxin-antitoxin system
VIRVVLDANVLISGLISEKGAPGKIIEAWLEGRFQLCVSPPILDELSHVLKYPRIMKRLEKQQSKELLKNLATLAELVDGKLTLDVLTLDPSDNAYLACAVEAHCDFLVTGNSEHFHEAGPKYKGVEIISPRSFLDNLSLE